MSREATEIGHRGQTGGPRRLGSTLDAGLPQERKWKADDGRVSGIAQVRGALSSAEGSKHEGRGERMESGNLSIALSEEPNMEKVRKRDQGLFLKVHLSLLENSQPYQAASILPKTQFPGPSTWTSNLEPLQSVIPGRFPRFSLLTLPLLHHPDA